jgi:hypothetical protein
MTPDILALAISALAGVITAFLSWFGRLGRKGEALVLRQDERELTLGDPTSLDPESVEQRIRALAQIAPDAAVVDAWKTLEGLVGRDTAGRDPSIALYGRHLRDHLLSKGLVDKKDAQLIDSLWQARNAALHMTESVAVPTVESYLPLILSLARKVSSASA